MTALGLKAQRLLDQLGAGSAFKRGARRVAVGPVYELRKEPGILARLVFEKEEGVLNVGYATLDGDTWEVSEIEPFSLRSLGYYERRLKRLGDFAENRDPEILA